MGRKFECAGSVGNALRSGRPRDARTEENVCAVAQAVVEEPTWSTQRGALQLGLSRRTYQCKNLVMQRSGTFFSSANLNSDFCTTPYLLH